IVGSVELNQKPIQIGELERFFRIAAREFQIAFGQFRARLVRIEAGNSEVVVIERGWTLTLLDPKEGFSDAQNMDRLRLLLQGHPEELLVELRRLVKVGNTHSDMVYRDGLELGRLRRCLRATDQCSEGEGE